MMSDYAISHCYQTKEIRQGRFHAHFNIMEGFSSGRNKEVGFLSADWGQSYRPSLRKFSDDNSAMAGRPDGRTDGRPAVCNNGLVHPRMDRLTDRQSPCHSCKIVSMKECVQ